MLRRAGDLWAEHAEEISWWNIREVGTIPGMAGFALHVAAQECYEASALPSRAYGELIPTEEPRLSMARRVPAGVVGVISPFNVPIILGIRSVAPALALGNAVILKPDPRTAVTGGVTIARIFEEAGLPAGVLQMLPGGVDVGEALVTHPLVRVISFTGSTAVGRRVGELAARHLKRVHLELGGNSAMIVLDDADVDAAVGLAAWGSFFHQGQICMTTGRHIVAANLYDDFVDRLAAKAEKLPVGNPATDQVALGPVIDAKQRDKIHSLVTQSQSAGSEGRGRWHLRGFVLPANSARRPIAVRPSGGRGGVRSGRTGAAVLVDRRSGPACDELGVRPVPGHRHAGRHARSRTRRPHPVGDRAHQRPDRERRGERAVRWRRRFGYGVTVRRCRGKRRRVHRDALGHDPAGARHLPVLMTAGPTTGSTST